MNLPEQCLLRIVSVKKVSVKNNEFIRSPHRRFVDPSLLIQVTEREPQL